jgi:iron complex outermembrane receptor protein
MKVSLSGGYHEDDTGNPGALKQSDLEAGIPRTGTINPDDFADIEDYYIKLKPEVFFLENSLFQFDLSYRERKSLFFSSFFAGASFEADTDIETVIASPQLIFKEQLFGFDNNLILGFDFTNAEEDIVNTITGFPTSEFTLEKENYGFYIHDEFYFTDNLSVSGGYRCDKADYKFKNSSTTDKADLDENPYTAGVNYNFYKSSYLYFSFSHSFRYPVFEEFFNFTSNTFNTDLIPQTSDDYEFGVRHNFSESFYATANIFRIDTDDEIFLNPDTFSNENLDGKTRRDGIEILLVKDFKNISLTGSYTYTDAEVKNGRFAGNQVPAVPEHKATAEAVFSPVDGFTIAINGYYIGERFFESDFANDKPKQDHYIVLNTKLKYTWEKYTAFLDINNFLDEEYSEFGVLGGSPVEPAFYPSPEINFLVGVSAVF